MDPVALAAGAEVEVGVEVELVDGAVTGVGDAGAGPVGVAPAVIPSSAGVRYVVTTRSAVRVGTALAPSVSDCTGASESASTVMRRP